MRLSALAISLLCLVLAACSAEQTEGDFMYLRNAGADLPILVRGNVDSGVLIVWLSPGPGDPVSVMRGEATDALEREYGVVYWDQRGCGSAQGNPSPESFTMEQFVEDTGKVIALVRERYHAQHIFLLGHSWGGTLGVAYLLDPKREARISGFIDLAGNHDVPLVYPMKLAWLQRYAQKRIDAGSDVAHWTKVRDFCAAQPPLTRENLARWEEYVDATDAAFHDPAHGFDVGFERLFRSPDSPLAYLLVNRDYVDDSLYKDDAVLFAMSYSERMAEITLPALLLWGELDGIVPLDAAHAAYDSLGTPESEKRLVTFAHSAHFPFLEEPRAFVSAVREFIEESR
jgi:proline iminopeptidase